MPRTEDGEFELVLGNKQLLSVFFLVVVLLGVFFTMGYIVGRNSTPLLAAEQPTADAPPLVIDTRAQETPAKVSPSSPGEVAFNPPASAQQPATAAEPEPSAPQGLLEPRSGERYLQVLATARTEADLIAESLRKKGYRAHVTTSPSPTLFRVLVGPFTEDQTAELSKTRDALVGAGFNRPIMRKY
jgi:cell division septation protein DedD